MRNDISIRNGKIMLDGYTVYDGVNCTITATPEVQTSVSATREKALAGWT